MIEGLAGIGDIYPERDTDRILESITEEEGQTMARMPEVGDHYRTTYLVHDIKCEIVEVEVVGATGKTLVYYRTEDNIDLIKVAPVEVFLKEHKLISYLRLNKQPDSSTSLPRVGQAIAPPVQGLSLREYYIGQALTGMPTAKLHPGDAATFANAIADRIIEKLEGEQRND